MNKLKEQIKKFIIKEFEDNVPAIIDEEEAISFINDLEREGIINFYLLPRNTDSDYWLEAHTGVNIDNKYYGITFDCEVKLNDTLKDLIEDIVNLDFKAREIKKKFEGEKDTMWEPFQVLSICREDLQEYLTKKEILKVDDGKMQYLAGKLGDALMDGYWISLDILVDDLIKNK